MIPGLSRRALGRGAFMSFGFAFHSKTKGGAGCSKAFRLRQFGHRIAFTFMLVISYERHSGGRGAAFRQRNGGAGRRVHPLHIFCGPWQAVSGYVCCALWRAPRSGASWNYDNAIFRQRRSGSHVYGITGGTSVIRGCGCFSVFGERSEALLLLYQP